MRLVITNLVCASLVFLPLATARAEPPSQERREQREQRREERKQEHQQKREDRREERAERRDAGLAPVLAEERHQRRRKHREELRQRWGELLAKPAVRAELRVHAERVARLNAIRRRAQAEGKPAIVLRADKLLEKERARHRRHMENLKHANSPPSAAAAGGVK